MEDGVSTTTYRLLKSAGYDIDRVDPVELMTIDSLLKEEASQRQIKLDMAHHENKVEGLPFNLDFIVYHKRR